MSDPDSFVLHALRAHESREFLALVDLVVLAMLVYLECSFLEIALLCSLVPDIDECSSANECNMDATCTNTIGSYNCTCKKGYQGDGRNCPGKVHCKEGIMDL